MVAWLRGVLAANAPVVTALYGQAFFVLGLATALQWRRESRLELARSVPLLAAFGLLKATAVWGDLIIPRQADLLMADDLALLRFLQNLLFLAAFAALLHFGIRLNWESPPASRLPWLMALVGAAVMLLPQVTSADPAHIRLVMEQLARPLFIFPGALLAAWGLRRTALDIEAMGLSQSAVEWLRVGGVALGAYALFGGLLIPLRTEQLDVAYFSIYGVPVPLLRLVAITVLAWAMIQSLRIFRVELQQANEAAGRLRALASDRQRIGRELHDGTIQAIYAAGLMIDNARSTAPENPAGADQLIDEGLTLLNRTISDIRRYIFELSDEEGQLAEALGKLLSEMDGSPLIEYRIAGSIPRLAPAVRDHLIQMAREAISNAKRHANAQTIVVALDGDAHTLLLTISDDGQGLPVGGAFREGGRGIPNLKSRAEQIGARLTIANRPTGGTEVEISLPHSAIADSSNRPPSSLQGTTP